MANAMDNGDLGISASRSNDFVDAQPISLTSKVDVADDLPALLSRAALSESQYKEFAPPARASQQIEAESPSGIRPPSSDNQSVPKDHRDASDVIGLRHLRVSEEQKEKAVIRDAPATTHAVGSEIKAVPLKHSSGDGNRSSIRIDAARSGRKTLDSTVESRWSVLGRALPGEMDDSPGRLIQSLANTLTVPFTFVCSVGGGTGVTTIAATLARCLAAEGERVLLADSNSASLFPLYFGASNPGTEELHTFSVPGSDGCVDAVNRSEPGRASKTPRADQETERRNLVLTIRNASMNSHRLLIDPGIFDSNDIDALQSARQFGLIPLVPDLSCVFGLLRLEQALREQESKSHESNKIVYVLNKFDSSVALHRDIKASLDNLLGDKLLPITLRRSDAVAEALADGMSVTEYRPESGIAQDFFRLAAWLREFAPASGLGRSN